MPCFPLVSVLVLAIFTQYLLKYRYQNLPYGSAVTEVTYAASQASGSFILGIVFGAD